MILKLSEPDEWKPLYSSFLVLSELPGDILKSILAFSAQKELPSYLQRLPSKDPYFLQWRPVLETKSEHQGAHESWWLDINATVTVLTSSDRSGKMFKVGEFMLVLPI